MSWLDAPKSEHIIRREHFVAGVETERERITTIIDKWFDCVTRELPNSERRHIIPLCPGCVILRDINEKEA